MAGCSWIQFCLTGCTAEIRTMVINRSAISSSASWTEVTFQDILDRAHPGAPGCDGRRSPHECAFAASWWHATLHLVGDRGCLSRLLQQVPHVAYIKACAPATPRMIPGACSAVRNRTAGPRAWHRCRPRRTAWPVGSVLVSDTNCMTKGVAGASCSCCGVPDCSTSPRLNTTTWSAMSNASSCGESRVCG